MPIKHDTAGGAIALTGDAAGAGSVLPGIGTFAGDAGAAPLSFSVSPIFQRFQLVRSVIFMAERSYAIDLFQ